MPSKSTDFKKFQRRIKRSLNYDARQRQKQNIMSAQISRMLATFLNQGLDLELTEKLSEQGFVSPYNLLTAMVYIARLKHKNEQDFIQFNPEELYLSSLMLATKFLNDGNLEEFIWNDEWASASGIDLPELNRLELKTLKALDWNTFVSEDSFEEALLAVEEWVANDLYTQNGQFTYNNLYVLSRRMGADGIKEAIKICAKLLLCAMLAYVAFFSLLLASMSIAITSLRMQQQFFPASQLDMMGFDVQQHHENMLFLSPFQAADDECLFMVNNNRSASAVPLPFIGALALMGEQRQWNFSIY